MPTFEYTGRNARGERISGEIAREDIQGVIEWMRHAGIRPLNIRQALQAGPSGSLLARLFGETKIKADVLLLFTRQLGLMLKAGLPIVNALEGLQAASTDAALIRVLRSVRVDLDKGSMLSQALARHPSNFNSFYISMVRSGEDSGTLDETLLKVHKQLQFDREVARQIKSAMRYPTFVLIAISIAIAVLSVKVIPVFAKLFASMKVQLPLMTRVLIGFSDFVMNYWWGIIGFAVVIVALARSLYSTPDGRYQWDRWKNKIPIVGGILYKATMARLAYTFASASRSGVPLLNTLKLSAAVTENQFFIERINLMCNMVQRGESLYASALGSGLFMAVELQMISAGEATGRVDEMMEHVASMYEEDTRAAISALSQSIEPILIVMMSLIVGVLVLGIFVPMWDMGQAARAR